MKSNAQLQLRPPISHLPCPMSVIFPNSYFLFPLNRMARPQSREGREGTRRNYSWHNTPLTLKKIRNNKD